MSIVWAEGFDDGIMRGAASGSNAATVQSGGARTGANGVRCQTGGSGNTSEYIVSFAAMATGWLYFAFKTTQGNTGQTVVILRDDAVEHLRIIMRSDGKFEVKRSTGNTTPPGTALTGGVGTFVYTPGSWVHCAMKWTISDTVGAFELRVNGSATADISVSGADTQNAGTSQVTNAYFGPNSTNVNSTNSPYYYDDIIVQNTSGSSPENTWLGDVECNYLFPDGAGSSSGWSIAGSSPAATRWQSVNEATADDAVTTVETTTLNDILLMTYANLSVTTGTIYAVVPLLRALKSSAGSRAIRAKAKLAGVGLDGTTQAISTTWLTYQPDVWHRDPSAAVWTGANVNASEFGIELIL